MKLSASMLAQQHDLVREATIKMLAERDHCLKAVDDEPEPDEAFGVVVRIAKQNIRKRIEGEP